MKRMSIKGYCASKGKIVGKAALLPSFQSSVPRREIQPQEAPGEIERFLDAAQESRGQLQALVGRSNLADEFRYIFEAQMLLLEDPLILERTREEISTRLRNAEWIVVDVFAHYKDYMSALDNRLFRERAADLEDIENRILSNLMNISEGDVRIPALQRLQDDSILIAEEVSPSLMLHINRIGGIVTEQGGVTGHLAILAHNRGIPALVGAQGALEGVREGERLFLDADNGLLHVEPREDEIALRLELGSTLGEELESILDVRSLSGEDEISLWANMDQPEDADDPRVHRAQGVGLFRTEFLYLKNPDLFASEEAQTHVYAKVLAGMAGKPVIFRLLDFGDDKTFDSYLRNLMHMGGPRKRRLRGIGFLLANQELLALQLRAILRASLETNAKDACRIMLPMVSTLEEMTEFYSCLETIRSDLSREIDAEIKTPSIGIMLETPASCFMADVFSERCDFFSVGTNDLSSSLLARDRRDLSHDSDFLRQPSVFRAIKTALDGASVPLSVCGEIASLPEYLRILLGLGVRRVSVSRSALASCGRVIRDADLDECEELARRTLQARDCTEVQSILLARA